MRETMYEAGIWGAMAGGVIGSLAMAAGAWTLGATLFFGALAIVVVLLATTEGV